MKIITILLLLFFISTGYSLGEERPSNELPMYGGADKSHIKEDKKYSKNVAMVGWKYYSQGNFNTAIKRFNQAWMFDHYSIDALWGFGLVMGQRATQEEPIKNLNESIRCLEMAKSLSIKNARLIIDLAYSYTLLGAYLKEEKRNSIEAFKNAHDLFIEAQSLQPEAPMLYVNWSTLEFYKENYPVARELLDQAVKYGHKPDPGYEKDLNEKL